MDYNWIVTEDFFERIDSVPYKKIYKDLSIKLRKNKVEKLNSICELVKCGPFGSTVLADTYSNDGVLYLRPVNISDNKFSDRDITFLSENDVLEKKLDLFSSNDLFFARVGNPSVSKVNSIYNKVTISPNIVGVKVGDRIDSDYLWMFLSSKYGLFQLERMLKTVAQPTTSTETIKEIDVLIANENIQKYIGDKVREAEQLNLDIKKIQDEVSYMINSQLGLHVLDEKFTQINEKFLWVNSQDLEERMDAKQYSAKVNIINNYFRKKKSVKLSECLSYYSRGKSNYETIPEDVFLIKTKNLKNSYIEFYENYDINFKCKNENSLYLNEKDIIIATMGVGSLGKVDMFYPKGIEAMVDGTLAILRFKDDSILKPGYLMEFLRTEVGQTLIYRNIVGSTGIISISLENILNLDIPLLEENIQNIIDEKVCMKLKDIYLSKKLLTEAMKDVEDLIEGNFDMSKIKETN